MGKARGDRGILIPHRRWDQETTASKDGYDGPNGHLFPFMLPGSYQSSVIMVTSDIYVT